MLSPNTGWAFFMRAWQGRATGPTVKIRRPALFQPLGCPARYIGHPGGFF